MYCKTAPSRCGVSNTSHSRGEHRESTMKSVVQWNSLEKVEHLEDPVKYQTEFIFFMYIRYFVHFWLCMCLKGSQSNRQTGLWFIYFPCWNKVLFSVRQVEGLRQQVSLFMVSVRVDKHQMQTELRTTRICIFRETAALCTFTCHVFFGVFFSWL